MWIDCIEIDKLVNLDHIQSFDIMKNEEDSEHDYRVGIQYANVFNMHTDVGDDTIFEGTFEECKARYNHISKQITILEKEVIATIRMLSQNIALSTMKPRVAEYKPEIELSKPDIDMPQPDVIVEDSEKPNLDKRVRLYVRKSDLPPQPDSIDMRSRKGGLGILTSVIIEMSNIREGRVVLSPQHWYNDPGDRCYTISSNMARNPQLKEYYTNKGFVTLED